mmetsp:Transcript_38260/g.85563  ORF Transcript_38260/g.85563 Transcript_38260/m.85563 type:complete len:107 (+) Transcript_38260:1-321(+)
MQYSSVVCHDRPGLPSQYSMHVVSLRLSIGMPAGISHFIACGCGMSLREVMLSMRRCLLAVTVRLPIGMHAGIVLLPSRSISGEIGRSKGRVMGHGYTGYTFHLFT